MDMLSGKQITAANLPEWRKLGQGLHRFVIGDFSEGVRFLAAISETGTAVGIISRFGSAPATST